MTLDRHGSEVSCSLTKNTADTVDGLEAAASEASESTHTALNTAVYEPIDVVTSGTVMQSDRVETSQSGTDLHQPSDDKTVPGTDNSDNSGPVLASSADIQTDGVSINEDCAINSSSENISFSLPAAVSETLPSNCADDDDDDHIQTQRRAADERKVDDVITSCYTETDTSAAAACLVQTVDEAGKARSHADCDIGSSQAGELSKTSDVIDNVVTSPIMYCSDVDSASVTCTDDELYYKSRDQVPYPDDVSGDSLVSVNESETNERLGFPGESRPELLDHCSNEETKTSGSSQLQREVDSDNHVTDDVTRSPVIAQRGNACCVVVDLEPQTGETAIEVENQTGETGIDVANRAGIDLEPQTGETEIDVENKAGKEVENHTGETGVDVENRAGIEVESQTGETGIGLEVENRAGIDVEPQTGQTEIEVADKAGIDVENMAGIELDDRSGIEVLASVCECLVNVEGSDLGSIVAVIVDKARDVSDGDAQLINPVEMVHEKFADDYNCTSSAAVANYDISFTGQHQPTSDVISGGRDVSESRDTSCTAREEHGYVDESDPRMYRKCLADGTNCEELPGTRSPGCDDNDDDENIVSRDPAAAAADYDNDDDDDDDDEYSTSSDMSSTLYEHSIELKTDTDTDEYSSSSEYDSDEGDDTDDFSSEGSDDSDYSESRQHADDVIDVDDVREFEPISPWRDDQNCTLHTDTVGDSTTLHPTVSSTLDHTYNSSHNFIENESFATVPDNDCCEVSTEVARVEYDPHGADEPCRKYIRLGEIVEEGSSSSEFWWPRGVLEDSTASVGNRYELHVPCDVDNCGTNDDDGGDLPAAEADDGRSVSPSPDKAVHVKNYNRDVNITSETAIIPHYHLTSEANPPSYTGLTNPVVTRGLMDHPEPLKDQLPLQQRGMETFGIEDHQVSDAYRTSEDDEVFYTDCDDQLEAKRPEHAGSSTSLHVPSVVEADLSTTSSYSSCDVREDEMQLQEDRDADGDDAGSSVVQSTAGVITEHLSVRVPQIESDLLPVLHSHTLISFTGQPLQLTSDDVISGECDVSKSRDDTSCTAREEHGYVDQSAPRMYGKYLADDKNCEELPTTSPRCDANDDDDDDDDDDVHVIDADTAADTSDVHVAIAVPVITRDVLLDSNNAHLLLDYCNAVSGDARPDELMMTSRAMTSSDDQRVDEAADNISPNDDDELLYATHLQSPPSRPASRSYLLFITVSFISATDLILLLIFLLFLLGRHLQKNLRLRRFKSNRDEI